LNAKSIRMLRDFDQATGWATSPAVMRLASAGS